MTETNFLVKRVQVLLEECATFLDGPAWDLAGDLDAAEKCNKLIKDCRLVASALLVDPPKRWDQSWDEDFRDVLLWTSRLVLQMHKGEVKP